MIEVEQTRGINEDGLAGNCYAACLSSILEIPLEEIPYPTMEEMASKEAFKGYDQRLHWDFLGKHGFYALTLKIPDSSWVPMGYAILTILEEGDEEGSSAHCVVTVDGEIRWDPDPSRALRHYGRIIDWTVLVPLNPAKFLKDMGYR